MSANPYLVFRRFGLAWAIPTAEVAAVTAGTTVEIQVGASTVPVDEVVGVVENLPPLAPARTLAAFWPHPFLGLSVLAHEPVVVLRSENVPSILCKGEP